MRYIVILLFALNSCNVDNCSSKLKFKLDYYAFQDISVDGNSYCDLVNKSLSGDATSILHLSKIVLYDGASYEHGAVLIEIIDTISELKYCEIISVLTNDELRILLSTIKAGLDYTPNKKYSRKNFKDIFPILSNRI